MATIKRFEDIDAWQRLCWFRACSRSTELTTKPEPKHFGSIEDD